jgi:drug/metabolite transporter (DMT)-like permease
MPSRPSAIHWFALAFLVVVGGMGPIAIKIGMYSVGPYWLVATRTLMAAVVMTFVLWGRVRLPQGREWLTTFLIGVTGWTGAFTFTSLSAPYVPAPVMALMWATSPIFLAVAAIALFRQRPNFLQALGLVLGLAGVAEVVLLRAAGAPGGADAGIWPYVSLLCGVLSFCASALISVRSSAIPTLTKGLGALYGAAAVSVPLALVLEPFPDLAGIRMDSWAALLYLGLVNTGINGLLVYWLVDKTSPQFMALSNYLAPIFAIVFAMVLLGETLGPWQYLGIAVILLGTAMSEWRPRGRGAALPVVETVGEPVEVLPGKP